MVIGRHLSSRSINRGQWARTLRDIFCQVYFSADLVLADDAVAAGDILETQLHHISISKKKLTPITIIRHASSIHEDISENFVLSFPMSGSISFRQSGKEGGAMPGQVILFSSSEEFVSASKDNMECMTLKIPSDILRDRVHRVDDLCARPDMANPLLVPVVSHFAAQLLKFDGGSSAESLERTLLDLICLMMETRGCMPSDLPVRRTLTDITYDRLVNYMRNHLDEPDLSPAKVACAHRMSASNLHRIFQMHGQTFGKLLMQIRLMEAHRLLIAPVARCAGFRRHISDIAFLCGFTNQSHFSARFREYFGTTPRSVLSNGPADAPASQPLP